MESYTGLEDALHFCILWDGSNSYLTLPPSGALVYCSFSQCVAAERYLWSLTWA